MVLDVDAGDVTATATLLDLLPRYAGTAAGRLGRMVTTTNQLVRDSLRETCCGEFTGFPGQLTGGLCGVCVENVALSLERSSLEEPVRPPRVG